MEGVCLPCAVPFQVAHAEPEVGTILLSIFFIDASTGP